jgi:transcriptional regulator GlxA family with amidase domain
MDIVTCAGVTSGLDLALWLVERYHGRPLADGVALEMEHTRAGTEVTSHGVRPATG